MTANDGEFYVPDEDVGELLAAYEAGDKGVTAAPATRQRTLSQPAKLTRAVGWLSSASLSGTSAITGRSARFTTATRTFTVKSLRTSS
jgi:hypothetical protein